MKNKDVLELISLIFNFLCTIICCILSSIILVYGNSILFDKDYKLYISDYKSLYRPIVNISFSVNSTIDNSNFNEAIVNPLYYFDCTFNNLTGEIESNNTCASYYYTSNKINDKFLFYKSISDYFGEKNSFLIISSLEECQSPYRQCFSNSKYKTCINDKESNLHCPITFITDNKPNFTKEELLFYPFLKNKSKSQVLEENAMETIMIDDYTKLYYSTNLSGIPITYIGGITSTPCRLNYIIFNNLVIFLIQIVISS